MVDLTLAKQHIRVTHDDEDELIQQYINSATVDVEGISGQLLARRIVTQQFAEFTDWLPLDWAPDPEDIIVSYFDSDGVPQEISDARAVRNRLFPADKWPTIEANSVIEVSYIAGWESEPVDLVDAVLVLVSGKYDNREGGYGDAIKIAEAICGHRRAIQV